MKLPSIQYLTAAAEKSFKRFPMSLLSSILAASCAITLVELNTKEVEYIPLLNLMLCCGLGIGLFFCIDILLERRDYGTLKNWMFRVGGLIILVLIYFTLPGEESTLNTSVPYVRYGIYSITVHLLVSFAPFIRRGEINGFWNYNKTLFLRFLLAVLFSIVLYVGLAIALSSLHFLFDVKIHNELYFEIWIVLAGVFNTWFFLAEIPADFESLDNNLTYPNGLRIFTQFVLLPLLVLYLIILYAYGYKIVASGDWPKGMVVYLVTGVAVLGILTTILLKPYAEGENKGWITKLAYWYYAILLPLVGLHFYALSIRLSDYGITINRYVMFLLGFWLVLNCGYFLLGRKNIKFIPTSLAVMLVLMSFGPWSMFSVSENSQVNRLEAMLSAQGVLVDGKISNEVTLIPGKQNNLDTLTKRNDQKLTDSLRTEITSIMRYLDNHHGLDCIQPWFQQDLKEVILAEEVAKSRLHTNRMNSEFSFYMAAMGITESYYFDQSETTDYYNYNVENDGPGVYVGEYSFYLPFSIYQGNSGNENVTRFKINGVDGFISFSFKANEFYVVIDNIKTTISLDSLVSSLPEKYGKIENVAIPDAEFRIPFKGKGIKGAIQLTGVNMEGLKEEISLNSLRGYILLHQETKK